MAANVFGSTVHVTDCNVNHFPNTHTLLLIMAVLPVSTSSVERSFSTLKRIKSYLRNEERLNALALIFIHRDLSIQVENNEIINKLSQKSRRINLCM